MKVLKDNNESSQSNVGSLLTSSPYVGLGPQLTTLSSAARTMLVLLLQKYTDAFTIVNTICCVASLLSSITGE